MDKFLPVLLVVFGVWLSRNTLFQEDDSYLRKTLNTTYDYIIVGAGSSGAVIASRLSEDPDVTVLLVEAGGSDLDDDNIRVPLYASAVQKTKADWAYFTVPQKQSHFGMNEQRSYCPRGRVLGGTSNLNYMAYVRGSRHDYDQWDKEGCTGWSYKDVLPYFLKSEDIQISNLDDSPYHSKGGYLTVTQSVFSPLAELCKAAAEETGYKTIDINGEDQIGFSYMQNVVRSGERCSTSAAFLRPVLNRPNLHISIDSLTTKVIIEDKKAKGIEMIKNTRKMSLFVNKEVILSGGAINSPALLMLSGIGPKEHLRELGIPLIADLPVGSNLQDHMMFHAKYNLNSSLSISSTSFQEWFPKLQYALTRSGIYSASGLEGHVMDKQEHRDTNEPDYPDYQLTLFSVAQDKGFLDYGLDMNFNKSITELFKTRAKSNEMSFACIPLHPKSKGTIRLQSRDPFDPPIIDPNYLDNPYDVKVFIAAIRKTEQLMKSKAFQRFGATLTRRDFPGICDKSLFDSDEYWECLIRYFAVTVYHPTSTCRMGTHSDTTAVVDPELRVKGPTGLRVADASIMRNLPSGNTNAPAIMIGEKVSDMIRGKNTVTDFQEKINELKL